MGGVARRAWARNRNSIETTMDYNQTRKGTDHVTLPFIAEDEMVEELVASTFDNLKKKI
jgi:urocanate hydratase